VWFSKEKNYGFIEFASIEDAEQALLLDGVITLAGQPITVRRPTESSLPLVTATAAATPSAPLSGGLLAIDALRPLLQHSAVPLPVPGSLNVNKQLMQGQWIIPQTPHTSSSTVVAKATTPILRLMGALFWASESTSEAEYLDSIEDIEHGIRRFTGVRPKGVFVAKADVADPTTGTRVLNLGDVLIELADVSAAVGVLEKLKTRKYDGQLLVLSSVDESHWTRWIRSILVEMSSS
jgi:splicing factor U2AF subunit